jgi:hypothetical protein
LGDNATKTPDISGGFGLHLTDWVIMRRILLMDNTTFLLRGWREALAGDHAMSGEKGQAYSLVIEK